MDLENIEIEVFLEEVRNTQLKYLELLEKRKIAQKKYIKSAKGREANRKAQRNYYRKHLSTGRPVGRPKKDKEISND